MMKSEKYTKSDAGKENAKTKKSESGKSGSTETSFKKKGKKVDAIKRSETDPKSFDNLTSEMSSELVERGITFEDELGRGTFSVVKKGWCAKLKKTVAIKIIDTRKNARYTKKCLPREIDIVRKLDQNNIVKVYEVIDKRPFVCLIQDFIERGDLLQKIRRNKQINEKEGRIHFRQLIEAMKYMKSMEVVHRDIKCENILLDRYENVKITDFGFARFLKIGEKSKTYCGSVAYLAPEIIRAQPYDGYLSDLWSVGIVLYVMTTGMMPFDDRHVKKMLERQLQHRIAFPRSLVISTEVKHLIVTILNPIPQKRPTIEEVLRSKWLADTQYRFLMQPLSELSSENNS